MMINCKIHTLNLQSSKRKKQDESSAFRDESGIYITFCKDDSLENLVTNLSELGSKSLFSSVFIKTIISKFLSIIGVIFVLTTLLSISIYEDFFKKLLFETQLKFGSNEIISLIFVAILFLGLLLLPQAFDSEGSGIKSLIKSWLNADTRMAKKLKFKLLNFDNQTPIHLYNFDLNGEDSLIWKIFVRQILRRFKNINFYIRNDKIADVSKILNNFGVNDILVISENLGSSKDFDFKFLFSDREAKFYDLMRLCSTFITKKQQGKTFISFELFEYCGKNFLPEKLHQDSFKLISGFQNFITRSFRDFSFLAQEKSLQVFFQDSVKYENLQTQERELAQYLRNHIEHCLGIFDNPISLLILYHYIKDLVLDDKRAIKILEKFIKKVKEKQHYELINLYWFEIAGKMFEMDDIEDFESSNSSIYKKLSIKALDDLLFLFKRNGQFEEAILLSRYLYEINPTKYALNISSLYERSGDIKSAYENFPQEPIIGSKPTDIEIRYHQRKAAWIIISQRDEGKREEAKNILEKLNKLLFSHSEDNEPLWLWHFYNIKANLYEWEGDFQTAIKFYQKCLFVPALGAFEYGASFVNMAISYRFEFIKQNFSDQNLIQKAISLGRIGLNLKQSVGDRDELAIALHNLTLSMLYQISTTKDESSYQETLNLAQKALEILDETKSSKRLGIILMENFIIYELMGLNSDKIRHRLENLRNFTADELRQMKCLQERFSQIKRLCFDI